MTSFSNPTQVSRAIRVKFVMDHRRATAAEVRELAKIICAAHEPDRSPMEDMMNLDGMNKRFRQVKLWEYFKPAATAVLNGGWRRT